MILAVGALAGAVGAVIALGVGRAATDSSNFD
jgi:hypothetical protein